MLLLEVLDLCVFSEFFKIKVFILGGLLSIYRFKIFSSSMVDFLLVLLVMEVEVDLLMVKFYGRIKN